MAKKRKQLRGTDEEHWRRLLLAANAVFANLDSARGDATCRRRIVHLREAYANYGRFTTAAASLPTEARETNALRENLDDDLIAARRHFEKHCLRRGS
jgi:hypothetical protein